MKTLEHLFGWLLFSLSVLLVYGFLSLFLIGPPAHAGTPLPCERANNCNLDFLDHIFDGGVDAPDATYTLHITTNGNLEQNSDIFTTKEECEREGAYLEYLGKIRDFTCRATRVWGTVGRD